MEKTSNGQRIGYKRVSTFDQNPERQLENIDVDKLFIDKASEKDTKRPQLKAMLEFIREGDLVIVHSMDRLSRNLDDLRKTVKDLTGRGIKLQFIKENLIFSGEDSPMSNLLLSVMGAFAEFERSLIKERQMEGIAIAKKRGAYKGRKRSLTEEQTSEIKELANSGVNKTKIADKYQISRETLYRYLKSKNIK